MRHPNQLPPNLPIISLREPPSCDALGACQHPVECGTVCTRHPPARTEADERQGRAHSLPATTSPSASAFIWLGLAVTIPWIIMLAMVAGYVWQRFGPVIKAMFASVWGQ